ncbi:TRAF3-interacting protein 1 isoform X1 [Schistocerca piceifrons]|uniref:TRAF3-interacting protein 1 isoform X1 n=2 Tax=Schistocerca piceifrons TaxID=274613 RepID=UPI001F5E8CC8|nr:TRAF3-interacting protein 1 isoform X1 [Schistocerca piceifrons]XP_047120118.1 TRAF3-interacting protein 1 isoform X1 [Schistocerca piceifrons]
MTEEVKPEVIKKTQESLGKYIKRPPLTEKLLRKPPFRFLHDIVTCVIRETGFMNGVFSPDELNHENIKDKESKIAFLQKLIETVKATSDSNITARPSKIVAGHEPTKTNELLQGIAKALDKKFSGEETGSQQHADPPKAAKKDKESHSKASSKNVDEGKKKPSDKKGTQSKTSSREHKIRESKEPSMKKSSSQNVESKHSKTSGSKRAEGHTVESSEAKHKKGMTEVHKKKKMDVRSDTAEAQEHENILPAEGENVKPTTKQHETKMLELPSSIIETSMNIEKEKQELSAELDTATKKGKRSARQTLVNQISERDKLTADDDKMKEENEHPEPVPSSQGTEQNIVNPETKSTDMKNITSSNNNITNNNVHNGEGSVAAPKVNVIRPKTARLGSARPMSARPAAPRIRDRGEVVVPAEVQPVVANVNIITEGDQMAEQDENENYIVESQDQPAIEILQSQVPADGPVPGAQHGHLVSQILETQKELEEKRPPSADGHNKHLKRVDIEWEDGLRRERDSATREVERLRSSIQTLTRAANPLGKWMDFLQEDVDTMQRELEMWRTTNKELKLQLVQEQNQTYQLIEPLRRQLQHLGKATEDQQELITALKSKILQNDAYIHKLVT